MKMLLTSIGTSGAIEPFLALSVVLPMRGLFGSILLPEGCDFSAPDRSQCRQKSIDWQCLFQNQSTTWCLLVIIANTLIYIYT